MKKFIIKNFTDFRYREKDGIKNAEIEGPDDMEVVEEINEKVNEKVGSDDRRV